MDDQPIESRMHYALRMCASIIAVDMATFALAALVCLVLRVGITIYNFSTALTILGLLLLIFSLWGGYTGGSSGYALSLEVKLPDRDRPSAFSNITLGIAGLIAIISSAVLPLAF